MPYSFPKSAEKDVVKINSIRLAEVWLDEYKNFFYERIGYELGDYGDVSERRALRERLQCKSFDWYLKSVFPEKYIPTETLFYGEVAFQLIFSFFKYQF